MFSSSSRSFIDTLPRSGSEIEVDFALPTSVANGSQGLTTGPNSLTTGPYSLTTGPNSLTTGPNSLTISSSAKSDLHAKNSPRSFTTRGQFGRECDDLSDDSSIIDLRSPNTGGGGDQRRSRSLDALDEPYRELGPKSVSSKDIQRRSSRRSLNITDPSQRTRQERERRRSFHSGGTLGGSKSGAKGSSCGDDEDDDWTHEDEFFSRDRIRKELNQFGDFNSSRRWEKDTGQIFMRKPPKGNGNTNHPPSSPPRSPTFSFNSTISLLPSSENKRGIRQQIVVTVSCSLAPLACGFAIAYNLVKNPQNLITPELGFWSQYIFILGGVVGSFFSGVVSNHGRKIPLFFCLSVLMIGWMSVIFSVQAWMVLLFHGLCGGCTSIVLVLSQIYIAEISLPYVRGSLCCAPLLALHVGLLICLLLGDVMTWQNLAIAGASIITPFFVAVALSMPESPRYLIQHSPTDSLAILQWLRGFNNDVMEEYKDIADNYNVDRWSLDKDDFGAPSFWRPLVVSCALMFLYNMTGIASVAMYGNELFREMPLTFPHITHIIMVSIIIIGIIISSLLVDHVGRKLLLLLSLTIMAASSFTLGLFLFLKDLHKVETYFVYQWAAEVFSIVLFTLAHSSAIAPLAWITMGEIFGPRLKWVGVSVSSMVMWSSMLIVDLTYHKISIVIATGGLFWFHCIICVGGYIFFLLFFRELRDHKLDDISKVFLRKSENLIDTFITKI